MKHLLSFFLIISIFWQGQVFAAVAGSSAKMSVAVAGAIEQKMIRSGFAANDPRFQATLDAVAVAANDGVFSVASGAGGLGMAIAGVAGAPVWATIAVGVGVAALAFGAYYLLTSQSGVGLSIPAVDPVAATAPVSTEPVGRDSVCLPGDTTCTPSTYAFPSDVPYRYSDANNYQHPIRNIGDMTAAVNADLAANSSYYGNGQLVSVVNNGYGLQAFYGTNGASLWTTPNPAYVYTPPTPQTITAPFDQVIPQIPNLAMSTPLEPQSVADVATQLLNAAAAKSGYLGFPAPLSDPVTATDVINWSMQNPGAMPTPADVLAPMPQPVTIPNPVVSPIPTPTPTPTTSTTVDLGPDPGVGVPGLEDVPTAASILAPLLNLFPDLRSYVVPSHSAECPKPSMELWGKTLTLQGHCDLLDSPAVRQTLYLIMAAVWVMVAIFIVLAA